MKFRVKDLMSKDIKSLTPEMNAADALKLLTKYDISGLPVIDEKGALCGMFTEKDVLKAILPGYIKDVGSFIYAEDPKAEIKKMANIGKHTVRDLMRKEVVTVDEETALAEVSKTMLIKNSRRVVVVDKQNKPIGVIARCDVVRAFAREAGVL